MASDNVLWFVALIFAVVGQYCCFTFFSVTMANPTELTDDIISHKCVQDLKYMSADCSTNNLGDVPQDLHPNIQKLILARNPIDVLRNMSFVRYPLLDILDLDRCKIIYIENGTFYPLRHLKKLVLTRAVSIYALNGELFRHSVDLQFVDIGHNELGAIPYAISHFPNLTSVRLDDNLLSFVNLTCGKNVMDSIDLSNNKIGSILPENFVFHCRTRLLTLDSNPVQMIDPDVIASLPVKSLLLRNNKLSVEVLRSLFVGISKSVSIQELYLYGIGLGRIPPGLFDPLCDKSLSVLDLDGNEFYLKENIFFNLTYVSTLYLAIKRTKSTIQPGYFNGMVGLRHIAIDAITLDLNPNHETWQVNLTHLEMRVRALPFNDVYLTEDTFKGLDSLTTLIIVSKEVNFLQSTVHLHLRLPNFQQLYLNVSLGEYNVTLDSPHLKLFLCGDDIIHRVKCTVKILESAKSLKEVHMSRALAVTVASTKIFQELCNLTFLNISYNYIQLISPGSFSNLSFLEVLDLSANFITTVSSDTFRGLVALQVLRLEQNQLIHMSGNSLQGLPSLTNLNLGRNNLTSLHKNLFAASNMIRTLSLSSNQFVTLNSGTFDPILPTLKTVNMSGNPLVCNCESRWLVDMLGRVLIDAKKTFCSVTSASLEPVRGKAITLFVTVRYCPALTPYSVTIFMILSVSAISIVVYRNSYMIKYKLKLAILGYVEIQDARDRDDFEYDINIMFVEKDEEWARAVFRPHVQETLPEMHRIAFGDDDLTLGMHYFDAVYENVENSFKTVLLLSRAAVQDHIFMSKLRIAMDHVTDTQTENMVLVFIEDIPDAELPYLLRLYQTGHGDHLRWEEDEESQEYFWLRLTKMLPVNLKINNLIPPL